MNLTEMRTLVRRDLHDEDAANYRWTDDELDQHIAHALKEFSEAVPDEQKATLSTTSSLRDLDISSITGRVMIEALEYPVDQFPRSYQPFAVWGDVLTLLSDIIPDGSEACIYYGKLHTLDASSSTIPSKLEELVAMGAEGYAALEQVAYGADRVHVGGDGAVQDYLAWGNQKLNDFRAALKRLGRRSRVRIRTLYRPCYFRVSKTTDMGPGRE